VSEGALYRASVDAIDFAVPIRRTAPPCMGRLKVFVARLARISHREEFEKRQRWVSERPEAKGA